MTGTGSPPIRPGFADGDRPRVLADLATDLARRAGALVLEVRAQAIVGAETKTTPTDPVTEGDRAAESVVVDGIRNLRPDDTIVGEEGTDHRGASDLHWFVDPIDGTVNYLYGIPTYSISIGVGQAIAARDHEPEDGPGADSEVTVDKPIGRPPVAMLAGVVYNPVTDELFRAELGRGATLNGNPIHVSTAVELSRSLVGTGFSYAADRRRSQAATFAALLPEIRDIRRCGSASLDLCYVACGRFDGYYEAGLNPWDMAAGKLVATEAGAVVDDGRGGAPSQELVVAATPGVHRALADRLIDLDAHRAIEVG